MATGNVTGNILGQKFWNGGWVDYRNQSAYAGTNLNRCYTYILKFTLPDFVGVSESLTFNLLLGKRDAGESPTLRYAVCSSDANLDLYVDTNAEVADGNQIVSGTVTTPTLSQYDNNNWAFTIPINGITAGGTYYLFLWGYAPQTDPEWVTVYETTNHSVSIAYNSGCVYIDNGSAFEAYQVYIDNGTSWDLYIPYIDNGTGWDMCN